jgi:hypothetical protein
LHFNPSWARSWLEFLKIDFPRVPMTGIKELFVAVGRAGNELVGLHLLESGVLDDGGPGFVVEGSCEVLKGYPKFLADGGESVGRVYINEEQYFDGVRVDVWEFCVGGYQVCEKWLKDRRGRVLSFDDIDHYRRVVVSLGETVRCMGEVDRIIEGFGGWPLG